ncbi:ribosomal protein L1 [Cryphonectria parasitica EP155]|uniref:Ribosomal protein L1 n=1 Tax=Cryphonectria parasitica (strain ATCC 38755 / EP155) TaxID=660469 RepID=A0A9P4Y6D9_CRYP1|nr:ribosomal protein L1 [Cryphonectria parasitica EP155]KAF3767548.1 ribosomal protein L1 [Cryphonectria parasitica EP155]
MAPTKTVVKQNDKAPQFEVDPDQALKASKALLAHIQKTAAETAANATKKNILDVADNEEDAPSAAETPIWLTITTKRHIHDTKKLQPAKIALPHPLRDADADQEATICLIVPEPQRHYKNLVASDDFPDHLRARITRVVDLKHLTAKFRQYEAQRKLASEHDIFLGDDRIINRLPKALGKSFYKTTAKRPIPVVLSKKKQQRDGEAKAPRSKKSAAAAAAAADPDNINCRSAKEVAAEIEKALGCALVHLSPSTNTAVKVGIASLGPQALSENIVKVAGEIATKYVPKKKNGIKAIFVKGPQTVALPIWQSAELWVDAETDVIANGSEQAKAIEAKKEQANIGKKRKTAGSAEEEEPEAKKAKRANLPESNDDKLDKQIAERKAKLRGAKAKAKSALDE